MSLGTTGRVACPLVHHSVRLGLVGFHPRSSNDTIYSAVLVVKVELPHPKQQHKALPSDDRTRHRPRGSNPRPHG